MANGIHTVFFTSQSLKSLPGKRNSMHSCRMALAPVLLLLMLTPAAFCDERYSELSGKTVISLHTEASKITATVSYTNFTFYSQPRPGVPLPSAGDFIPSQQQTGQYALSELSMGFEPLQNASLTFTFNGKEVSTDGADPACNPAVTDQLGMAVCDIFFVTNTSGSGFLPFDSLKSCGALKVDYAGGAMGDIDLRPSSETIVLCPRDNVALSALGPALYASLGSPQNSVFCFPAMLIIGVLIASMYYSGRDPLSLFDLTTPRLPKAKQGRISGGAVYMSPRTAAMAYKKTMAASKKNVTGMLKEIAKRNKKNPKDAEKEIKRFFKEFEEKMRKEEKKKEGMGDAVLANFHLQLTQLFIKYGFDPNAQKGSKGKLFNKYMDLSGQMVKAYQFSYIGMRAMLSGRAPGGSRRFKWWGGKLEWLSDRIQVFDQKVASKGTRIPVVGKILQTPMAMMNLYMTSRATGQWARYSAKSMMGQFIYMVGTKRGKSGDEADREDRMLMKGIRGMFQDKEGNKTWLGKAAKWYYDWEMENGKDGFLDRHNIMARQMVQYRKVAENEQQKLVAAINYAHQLILSSALASLENLNEEDIKKLRECAKKNGKESEFNAALKNLEKLGDASHEKYRDAYSLLLKTVLPSDKAGDKKSINALYDEVPSVRLLSKNVDVLSALVKNRDQPLSVQLEALIAASGSKNKLYPSHLRVLADLVDRIAAELGIAKLRGEIFYKSIDCAELRSILLDVTLNKKQNNPNATDEEISNKLNERVMKLGGVFSQVAKEELAKNPHFFFDMLTNEKGGEALFNKTIGAKILKNSLANLEKEQDQLDYLSKLQKSTNMVLKAMDSKVEMGQDPAGKMASFYVSKILDRFKDEKGNPLFNHKIESINDLEIVFYRGAGSPAFISKLSAALANLSKKDAEQLFLDMGFDKKESEIKAKKLNEIAENRKAILDKMVGMDGASYLALCALLGFNTKKASPESIPRESALEQLYKLKGDAQKKAAALLEISDQKMLGNTSMVTNFMLRLVLERTQADLSEWGAKIARGGAMFSSGCAAWAPGSDTSGFSKELMKRFKTEQQIEFGALRTSLGLSQYHGESGQHIETLLGSIRAYNRGIEFTLSKSMPGASQAGSFLGAYSSTRDFMVKTYQMEKAMYVQLVGGETRDEIEKTMKDPSNVRLFDRKFLEKHGGLDKLEFDANGRLVFGALGYQLLQDRGFTFRDMKRGVGVWFSSDNQGAVPLIEYDRKVLAQQGKDTDKSILIKKDETPNIGALLARLNVSDYAGNTLGITVVRNVAGPGEPEKLRRIDPLKIAKENEPGVGVDALFSGSKYSQTSTRRDFANILAGAGPDAKPIFKFISSEDYITKHASKFTRVLQDKVLSNVSQFMYGAFYEQSKMLYNWFGAQARARDALYSINKISGGQMRSGEARLNASNVNLEDYGLSLDEKLMRRSDAEKADSPDERRGIDRSKVLRDLIGELSASDRSASWMRKNYAKIDEESAGLQDALYASKLELSALKIMHKNGLISKSELDSLITTVKSAQERISKDYSQSLKDNANFAKAMIEFTGSHDAAFGSKRNLLTLYGIVPAFSFDMGLTTKTGTALEASAMRDTRTARGAQIGMEYVSYMAFETGQGMYEPMKLWATGSYERGMMPVAYFATAMHRLFMPYAASYYRHQIGLPSYLQKTELEPGDFGNRGGAVKGFFQFMLGGKAGLSDFDLAYKQKLLDWSGTTTFVSSMAKSRKIGIDSEGNVYSETSASGRVFKALGGVESSWVSTDGQTRGMQRIQDRVLSSEVWNNRDSVVRTGGAPVLVDKEDGSGQERLTVGRAVKEWIKEKEEYDFSSGEERKLHQKELEKYESYLSPYMMKLTDLRRDASKYGYGGTYFYEDGSRDRAMNLFLPSHLNTWMQSVPGVFESNPYGQRILSPAPSNIIDRSSEGSRLGSMKNTYSTSYDESRGSFIVHSTSTIHQDSFRDIYRYDTSALMHLIKHQSYNMMYEGFNPIVRSLPLVSLIGGPIASRVERATYRKFELSNDEQEYIQKSLDEAGTSFQALRENERAAAQRWNQTRGGSGSGSVLQNYGERLLDRFHAGGEESDRNQEARRNMAEMLHQIYLFDEAKRKEENEKYRRAKDK